MERPDNHRWTSREVARLVALIESERRFFEEMVTLAPVAMATATSEGRLISANPAFLREFGIGRDELDRHSLWTLAGLPPAPFPLHGAMDCASDRHTFHIAPLHRWDRGEMEWMITATAACPAPQAAPQADPTFAASAAAVQAAQRLAARVTHEANNLIMIASGYGREILGQLPEGSPLREDVNCLLEATQRIEEMAVHLSDFSRASAATLAPWPLRSLLGGDVPNVQVTTDAEAFRAAYAALSQLAPGGLRTSAEIKGPDAVVTLRGFPFSAEILQQHMEALNNHARNGSPGARQAVLTGPRLLLAGARWRIGEPAHIEIRLPLADAVAAAPAAERLALIVDDEDRIRDIIRRVLQPRGWQTMEAGSADEALSLLSRGARQPDLLITDMRMPGMSGRDLADRVRHRNGQVRILFISGYTDDPNVQSGILPKGSAFLSKPFHTEQLAGAVTELMR